MTASGPITAILIGAGQRGSEAYGPYALHHPDELRFVAVAEPDGERRDFFAAQHHLTADQTFSTWEDLLSRPPLARAALVCTQDQYHTRPALAAMRAGYDVLLEKPMAVTAGDCRLLVQTAQETGRQLHICHVMRYIPHFQKMKEILSSGALGQVANISHRENVSYWHMAHSFVRGSWGSREKSSPMILAKCCHDLDFLVWLLEQRCESLSSAGSLIHYRPENAPAGAPQYCLDGCPASAACPYEAQRIYLEMVPLWRSIFASSRGLVHWSAWAQLQAPGLVRALSRVYPRLQQVSDYQGWPRSVVTRRPGRQALLEALRTGPYGRCVYHCDNDVVDNQVVLLNFPGGPSVTLTMHGHSHEEGRSTRIEGSRAGLQAFFGLGGSWIEVKEHHSSRSRRYDTSVSPEQGHGGGDVALMAAFLHSLRSGGEGALTTARQSLEGHLMAFAAEQARLEGRVVQMEELRKG